MTFRPRSCNLWSSLDSETPLWLIFCHSRRFWKIASFLLITPSLLPPFSALSNSASAKNPFFLCTFGCGVRSPNNSWPLSIVPLPLRSSANQASSVLPAVHDNRSRVPLPFRSKRTPWLTAVIANPSPLTSIRIGEPPQVSHPVQTQYCDSYSPPY